MLTVPAIAEPVMVIAVSSDVSSSESTAVPPLAVAKLTSIVSIPLIVGVYVPVPLMAAYKESLPDPPVKISAEPKV